MSLKGKARHYVQSKFLFYDEEVSLYLNEAFVDMGAIFHYNEEKLPYVSCR